MTNPSPTIAVVEDDHRLSEHLRLLITDLDWTVACFARAGAFFQSLRRRRFQAVLLDLHLPDLSAQRLLERLPQTLRARTIALTGRMDDATMEESFRAGLADFLVKPCRFQELRCRLNRVLERECELTSITRAQKPSGPDLGHLTSRERLCAEYFLTRPNQTIGRDELMWAVWQLDERITSRRVDTYVSRIRQKLGLSGGSAGRLVSVYGSGYRLETAC